MRSMYKDKVNMHFLSWKEGNQRKLSRDQVIYREGEYG